MTLLPIILAPDPILRKKATKVIEIDSTIIKILNDMTETMYNAPGIGLAAQQVGLLKRLIVMDCSKDEKKPSLCKMINPEIIRKSDKITKMEEGCLSLPGFNAEIKRYSNVTVSFDDINGEKNEFEAEGLEAVCLQHEIDHLNGILFIDHLTRLKKDIIWRKILKDNKSKKNNS